MSLQIVNSVRVIAPLHRQATSERAKCANNSATQKRKSSVNDFIEYVGAKRRKKRHKYPKKKFAKDNLSKLKSRGRNKKIRIKPEAPFNSTQFIMEEHNNLSDKDLSVFPRRQKDSLSLDSEEISSEDDQFLTKEFWSAYEDVHAERLDTMSKYQLVQEFFALEERITVLERELACARREDRERIREPSPVDEDDEEARPGEVPVDAETAAKIEVFASEIKKLEQENRDLREENCLLRHQRSCRRCIPTEQETFSTGSNNDSGPFSGSCDSEIDSESSEDNFRINETSNFKKEFSEDSNIDSGVASFEGGTSSGEEVKYFQDTL